MKNENAYHSPGDCMCQICKPDLDVTAQDAARANPLKIKPSLPSGIRKLYLAGPMRGLPLFNFPAFDAAASKFRNQGFDVFSPADRDREDGFNPATDKEKSIDYYMAIDLPEVCNSDAVVVLPGWEKSQGARLEIIVAFAVGKPVFDAETLEPVRASVNHGMQLFPSGANRSPVNPFDPEGFISPAVIRRFCAYMTEHRKQADGNLRDSDNWQKGIPASAYMKSHLRHTLELWEMHRGIPHDRKALEDTLCALMFNSMGYLFEVLRSK